MEFKSKGFNKIGIVGLGLIGGSLGLDLQKLGFQVFGLVHRETTLKRAKERQLAQVVDTDPQILSDCSLIILASPLPEIIAPSKELLNCINPNSVVTDVGSVKAPVIKVWEKLHSKFVGSHPMAGTSASGVEAGQSELFKNCPWVATPTKGTDQEALEVVHHLAVSLGSKWVIADAKAHDKAVALISHMPVIVSAALLNMTKEIGLQGHDLELARILSSSGYKDTTRVGGGNPSLGVNMACNNTESILEAINSYQLSLERLKSIIKTKEWEELQTELTQAKVIRSEFFKS